MAVNKVDVNGVTVLDLTQDSVTPATLKKGETAHDASGAAIVGEMESSAPSLQSKSVTYTENGTATITPDEGYDGLSRVDVTVDVSGGGGSVETVPLKVSAAGIPMWTASAFATGIDGVFEITNFGTYDVAKNSMFFLYGGAMITENLTELFVDRESKFRVYEVIGNATIKVS